MFEQYCARSSQLYWTAVGSLFLFIWTSALATDPLPPPSHQQRIIIPKLQGLVILGNRDKIEQKGLDRWEGLHIFDLEVPGERGELQRELQERFIDQPLKQQDLAAIKQAIALYFQRHGHPVQTVLVPGQNIKHGVLQVVVVEEHGSDLAVADDAWPHLPSPPPPSSLLPPQTPFPSTTPLLSKLTGIVLLGEPQLVDDPRLEVVQGILSLDVDLPGSEEDLQRRLSPFINQPLSEVAMRSIKQKILLFFKENSRPIVAVQIPEQDITSGVLKVLILQGKLGAVRARGNRWTKSRRLEEYIRLKPNQEIDENLLLQDLSFINRNPFRRVDVIYTPGAQPGTTDIELLTHDRRPWRIYAGGENSGVEPTGRTRTFAGFNWGNAFNLDHILSYQYTASTDIHKFQAQTLQYTAPLPWRHVLVLFGGYSRVHPNLHIHGARGKGYGAQASLRYDIPLKSNRSFPREFFWGFDFKRTNNVLEFTEEASPIGSNVNLTQLILGYTFNYNQTRARSSFEAELFYSPGQWLADQSNADFQTLRPFARNTYVYGKASFAHLRRLPKEFSLSLLLKGQLASINLLPSEQFGLGGYNTVRGYEEREFNADNALLASGEMRTPPKSLLHYFSSKKWEDALQLLAFIDYGFGKNHKASHGEFNSGYLLGIGPGLRYAIDPYLSIRFDWGFPLHRHPFSGQTSRIHFGVILSY